MEKIKAFKISRTTAARLLAPILALSLFLCGGNAFAATTYSWGVDRSPAFEDDRYGWTGNGSTKFSVDNTVHTATSKYSIKLDNTDYNISYVERTFNVEPYTTYRFSAMVKYSGYKLAPNADNENSGACVGQAYSYNNSGFTTSSDWTLMEYEFTTGNETTFNLALQNGIYNGRCMGTAWFSDVKLERAELTNSWNILAVFFRHVDAHVVLNGRWVNFKNSLTQTNIDEMNKYALDTLPENLKNLSDNRVTVNSIDRYYSSETLTEDDLTTYGSGYCVDETESEVLGRTLDKYLSQKHYNQILIFVPFYNENGLYLSGSWWGLGGTKYKGIHYAQITNSWDGAFQTGDDFQGNVSVHEICHGLEYDSKIVSLNTPDFHSTLDSLPTVSTYDKIHRFMTCTLAGGKGVDPSVYSRSSGKYALVSDDMTVGKGIDTGNSSETPPENFRVETASGEKINIGWSVVPNADGYQFAIFTGGDFKSVSQIFDCKASTTGLILGPIAKGNHYFGIRSIYNVNGTEHYSDWATISYTYTGADSVSGDVDNSGSFNFKDISAAVDLFLSGAKIDDRTAAALGISGRDRVLFSDINMLVKMFLEIV